MADRAVARRYASAFIELAEEARQTDELGGQLVAFYRLCRENDGALFQALANPVYTIAERRSVLDEVLKRVGLTGLCANLLRLLIDKGRFDALPFVVEAYEQYADERAGRVRVQVTTAEPLTPRLEAEVRTALERATKKDVVLEPSVDPTLIGGIVAKVGGIVYDSSLKTRLNDLMFGLLKHQDAAQA